MRFRCHLLLLLCLAESLSAQTRNRVDLGRLVTGATVSFTLSNSGDWGIEITGGPAPRISQPQPAKLEVYSPEEKVRQLSCGYKTVRKFEGAIDADAEIAYTDTAIFRVHDRWSVNGEVLAVRRRVEVLGNAPGGFGSAVVLRLEPSVTWADVNYM